MLTIDRIRSFLADNIGEDHEFKTKAGLARYLGLTATNQSKLFKFLKGGSCQAESVIEWIEKLGGNVYLPNDVARDTVYVPRVEAVAGAGESWVTSGNVLGVEPFSRKALRNMCALAEHCVVMSVAGDSMSPLINDGDSILIDKAAKEPQDGKIFVVSLGGVLMVKRMARIPYGWRLCSENRIRGDTDVEGDELEALTVHGLVKWCGHIL